MTAEKGKAIEISYTFPGILYCENRKRVDMFDYDTKEKEH
jgi:hypothetical protein